MFDATTNAHECSSELYDGFTPEERAEYEAYLDECEAGDYYDDWHSQYDDDPSPYDGTYSEC